MLSTRLTERHSAEYKCLHEESGLEVAVLEIMHFAETSGAREIVGELDVIRREWVTYCGRPGTVLEAEGEVPTVFGCNTPRGAVRFSVIGRAVY